eukprot:13566803-Alexandrium_andersonii.AAC.1
MRHSSIAEFDEVTLMRLAGRLVPLKHVGGGLRLRHCGHLEARNSARQRAQFTVDLGELGAQLNVEL